MAVVDECAVVTDVDSGRELVRACEQPNSNPLLAWASDVQGVNTALIRIPPGTSLNGVEPRGSTYEYDEATGWLTIEEHSGQSTILASQSVGDFRCEVDFAVVLCNPDGPAS